MRYSFLARLLLMTLSIGLMSMFALTTFAAFSNGQAADYVLGQTTFTSRTTGSSATTLNNPIGIAIDPTTGAVFVADTNNNRVLHYANITSLSMGAAAVGVLGQPNFTSNAAACTQSTMHGPFGLTLDSTGRLWVADAYNNRVLRFDDAVNKPNGADADAVLGQPSFGPACNIFVNGAASMNQPFGVAISSSGVLWVADYGNHRVLRYNDATNKTNGAPADRVLGQPDSNTTDPSTTISTMDSPYDVAISSNDTLWVADSGNNRVLRFDKVSSLPNGSKANGVLGQPDFSSKLVATSATGMARPTGVAIDNSSGTLWVAEYGNHRVLRFADPAHPTTDPPAADGVLGQADFTASGAGISASRMYTPQRVAVGPNSTLLVADTNNHRIMHFDFRNTQTMSFAQLSDMSISASPVTLSATTSSGLTVTFSSRTPTVCSVSGTTLTLVSVGTCTVTATQAGDALYSPVQASQTFQVQQAQRLFIALPLIQR